MAASHVDTPAFPPPSTKINMTSMVPSSSDSDSDEELRTINFSNFNLHLKQSFDRSKTDAVVWDAGLVLAYYLVKRFGQLSNGASTRRVIDVGSGTGVVGLTVAKLGAKVVLTDLAGALPLLNRNARRNGFHYRPRDFNIGAFPHFTIVPASMS